MEKELAKIASIALAGLVLSLLLVFLEGHVSSTVFVVLGSLFILMPILLAHNFLSCIAYGAVSGATQAIVVSAVSSSFIPILAVYSVSGISIGLSLYPFVKSKNVMFLVILFLGLGASIALNWFFWFYDYNLAFAFKSLFYIFK